MQREPDPELSGVVFDVGLSVAASRPRVFAELFSDSKACLRPADKSSQVERKLRLTCVGIIFDMPALQINLD